MRTECITGCPGQVCLPLRGSSSVARGAGCLSEAGHAEPQGLLSVSVPLCCFPSPAKKAPLICPPHPTPLLVCSQGPPPPSARELLPLYLLPASSLEIARAFEGLCATPEHGTGIGPTRTQQPRDSFSRPPGTTGRPDALWLQLGPDPGWD